MSFDWMIGQHNYIGVHAGGAAATAWVLANSLDTLHNGTGTPIQGMMYFSSTTNQMYFWDGSNWINYMGDLEGGIYVDAAYGSDISGDGTRVNPYQTLPYACTQVAAPVTEEEFVTPITFRLAPGDYPGPITLPDRLAIKIVGSNVRITDNIDWPIDPQHWADWALYQGPSLSIVHENKTMWADGIEGLCEPKYPSGFRLEAGTLTAYNSNPIGTEIPTKILTINGCARASFNVYNQPTGTAVYEDRVGQMWLFLTDSIHDFDYMGPMSWVCGEADRGSGMYLDNAVVVHAEQSYLAMYGCCYIDRLHKCVYYADYRLDHDFNPYSWGFICGSQRTDYENVRDSYPMDECFFGYDPLAPAPVGSKPLAITFDRTSLINMAVYVTDMAASFYGFSATSSNSAYGRGWYYGVLEAGVGPTVAPTLRVPTHGSWSVENIGGKLLRHTYACTANWEPNGQALSSSNPLTIELESGSYVFGSELVCDTENVHIIGKGSLQSSSRYIEAPSTRLYWGNNEGIWWGADNARLENVDLVAYGDSYGGASCMKMTGPATGTTFKNITFSTSKFPLYAVVIDPAVPALGVQATWIDCWTSMDGFLFGGNINGSFYRCTAANYSFGAWTSTTEVRNIVSAGYFEDCKGGQRCFGAVEGSGAGGGTAQFSGTALRCVVSQRGYGYTYHPTTAYSATCSGTMTDCDNTGVSGGRSFGYSESGQATCSGYFVRCRSGEMSFGCSGAAATYYGRFLGYAQDCDSGANSFGSNVPDPTLALFSGTARRCIADFRSFGARGQFIGRAYDCEATYGSFGWQTTFSKSVLDGCIVREILQTANNGPPGIFGATVRNCFFYCRDGMNVAPLEILGGTDALNQESRVYNCDLYSLSHAYGIGASNPFDVQVAHCRMRADINPLLTNILADPHNLIDPNYDPI